MKRMLAALLLSVLPVPLLAADIEVVALFTDTAVIRFGQRSAHRDRREALAPVTGPDCSA